MNDEKIMAILQSGKHDRALVRLYKYWPKVEKLIVSKGGSKEEAQDIFQEALIVFCKKVKDSNFRLTSSIDTYLYSVCRLLWKNESRKKGRQPITEWDGQMPADEESNLNQFLEQEERIKQAESVIASLSERCREILVLFYHKAMRMAAIAEKMGFQSEKVAKNQKYKCLEHAKLKYQELRA